MNDIHVETKSVTKFIERLNAEIGRLKHMADVVCAIPEINAMNPTVYLDNDNGWLVVFQFVKCWATVNDTCRARFVHYDSNYMDGRKEDVVPFYNDEDLITAFKNHVEFLR